MIVKQSSTQAKGTWQRKLTTFLTAGVLACLPMHSANALITNTVTATGNMGLLVVKGSATANVDVADSAPVITLLKAGTLNDGGDGIADPGDVITYTFTIKNTGNVTLKNITVSDTTAILTGAPIALLAPGDTNATAYTAQHKLTPADVIAGQYTNTANVTSSTADGKTATANASVQTTLTFTSSMSFTKSGVLNMGPNGRADAGDQITYSFVVKNDGATALTNVQISDPLVNLSSLPGRERAVALLDASQIPSDPIQTAAINAAPEQGNLFAPNAAAFAARLQPGENIPQIAASLNVTRQIVRLSASSEPIAEGDKIGFVYGLYNTGDVPLTTINVDQPNALSYGDSLDILAANTQDSASIIFTRSVTSDEIASGAISAPAMVTAHARGQILAQAVSGSMALSAIQPYDSFASASISPLSVPTLNPGASTTFTAIYTLNQADVDGGVVNNTATATAKNALDQTLTKTSSFQQTLAPKPGIAVIKSASLDLGPDNVASIGDIITYHFDVTNSGNVTLSAVKVTDLPGFTMSGGPVATLAPGIIDSTTFSATHALVQTDLDAGSVTNHATAMGTSPTAVGVSDLSDPTSFTGNAPTVTQLAANPKIALIKTVTSVNDVNGDGRTNVDDTITYGFKVKNIGNQTLTGVIVTDPKFSVVGAALPSMIPGAEDDTHFTGTYTITQADMDLGHIDNTARVDGTAPGNVNVFDLSDPGVFTQDAPTVTPLVQQPIIQLTKKMSTIVGVNGITDTNNNSVVDAGDVIHYALSVKNPGNVTLTNINVVDPLVGVTISGGPLASLAPGIIDATTFTATYTITAADVAARSVTNQATARAKPPLGPYVTGKSDNTEFGKTNPTVTPILATPGIALIKTVSGILDTNNDGVTNVGDTVTYTFSIRNTGNVALTNVAIADPGSTVLPAAPFSISNFPAGNTDDVTFTAKHLITAADIAAGSFSNQATVTGTAPNGAVLSDKSDFSDPAKDRPTISSFGPQIALVKKFTGISDTNPNGITDVGDTINYQFIVTNVGAGLLTNIFITDPNAVVTGTVGASLAAGASNSTSYTAEHVITAADMLAGSFTNQATAHGSSTLRTGDIADLSDPASKAGDNPTITALAQLPGIALLKKYTGFTDTNGSGVVDVGDVINYAITVVNTGNVNLSNIVVTDGNGILSPNPATLPLLAAGASDALTFTATHTVTPADADSGQVSNSASVTAKPPVGANVNDVSDFASLTGNNPTVTKVTSTVPILTKTAAKSEVKRGESIGYTITASNLVGGPFQLTDIMPPGFGYVAGSATINGVVVTPVVNVRNLDFNNLTPLSGKLTLKLKLLASTTLGGGKFINNAHLLKQLTGVVLGTAQATVTIQDEAVFDCSDIIGRVFDDLNANGYMDDGEPGLPGVRVVTLNGLLITTDSHGRYHVPCAAIPDASIGSNYLLKLDVRTLPTGYKLTTENPRDVRVTRGKVVKLNFGASILREVRVDVTGKAFDEGTTDLTVKWAKGIDQLMRVLAKQRSTLKIIYHRSSEDRSLAQERVAAVEDTVNFAWTNGKGAYPLVTSTTVEDGK